jgi:predicted alpha/beta superfamily hydrolase
MTKVSGESALENTEVHFLHSEYVQDDFRICIARPLTKLPDGIKLSVVYVLDANTNFGLVSDIVRAGEMAGRLAYVVGIGYRVNSFPSDIFVKRSRDFTPTPSLLFDNLGGAMVGVPDVRISTGGATLFLEFIRKELKPYIESLLQLDSPDNTLIGMSLGGLFCVWTLFNQPDTFQRYLACSPSLWWDNDVVFKYEKKWAEENEDLLARVFIAAGDEERHEKVAPKIEAAAPEIRPLLASFRNAAGRHMLAEHVEDLIERLKKRNYESLHISGRIFPEETHETVYPSALVRGLAALFPIAIE